MTDSPDSVEIQIDLIRRDEDWHHFRRQGELDTARQEWEGGGRMPMLRAPEADEPSAVRREYRRWMMFCTQHLRESDAVRVLHDISTRINANLATQANPPGPRPRLRVLPTLESAVARLFETKLQDVVQAADQAQNAFGPAHVPFAARRHVRDGIVSAALDLHTLSRCNSFEEWREEFFDSIQRRMSRAVRPWVVETDDEVTPDPGD